MATFAQGVAADLEPALFVAEPSGTVSPVGQGATNVRVYTANDRASADSAGGLTKSTANLFVPSFTARNGLEANQSSGGFDWFEDFHVVPRSFDFGNLLSDQSSPLEVFSAFRHTTEEWASFVNNAGTGVALSGAPLLPASLSPMTGIEMTLDVSTVGDPFVDSTLVFAFTGIGSAIVPIEIQRIVLWGLVPEMPFQESLESKTKVHLSLDGTERRESLRHRARQSWRYNYIAEEGIEAQTLENLLFDFQSRTFGVPVWFDDATLSADVAAGDTTVSLEDTAYRDFRVGGLAVLLTSQSTFDVLEVSTVAPTSLGFSSPTVNSYTAGGKVYPLSTCLTTAAISGGRWSNGLRRLAIDFRSNDNEVDLADLSPFSAYKSKLLLDNGNSNLSNTVSNAFRRSLVTIDGEVGGVFQDSTWGRHKRQQQFTLRASGRQAVWEMRGLVHAIQGRRVSFYVPTDSDDFEVVADLLSASNTMDVTNVGYSQFVRQRQPKSDIRISFVDGSPPLLRAIVGSSASSSTVEQLVVDTNWPSTITPAEISRIDYMEKVRLDTDRVQLEFDVSGHRAYMAAPVVGVFE